MSEKESQEKKNIQGDYNFFTDPNRDKMEREFVDQTFPYLEVCAQQMEDNRKLGKGLLISLGIISIPTLCCTISAICHTFNR